MALSILIAALSLVGLVAQTVVKARAASAPCRITLHSARDPREIRRAAMQFFTEAGWQAEAQSDGTRTFVLRVRPAGPEVVILLLLGVIPGILYLLLGKQTVRVSVAVRAESNGSMTDPELEQRQRSSSRSVANSLAMIRAQEPPGPSRLQRGRRRVALRRTDSKREEAL